MLSALSPLPPTEPSRVFRVLIVDDSRLQRHILKASLRQWGYDVFEAESGAAALEICRSAPPDIVISDWIMPGMDGPALCRAFRMMRAENYGYFVLLTAKSGKDEIARGLDAGADDFLTKPVNPAELRARLTAGERILRMQEQLQDRNRQLCSALDRLQQVHDSLQTDLREARRLQQSLIRAREQSFGQTRVSLMLRPCGHVGGDLVGMFAAGASHVGLFAIDVSGHGVAAALMTARLAGYLSGQSPEHNVALAQSGAGGYRPVAPEEVAARLNRLTLSEMETDTYFTLLYAVLDRRDGRCRMVQAGHPHPVVHRRSGRVEFHGRGGLPMGLFHDAVYEGFEVTLAPGDRLFVASDGVTECEDGGGAMLDEAGLARLLVGHSGLSGQRFLDALTWDLAAYAGSDEQHDDISAVLVEYGGPDGGPDGAPGAGCAQP